MSSVRSVAWRVGVVLTGAGVLGAVPFCPAASADIGIVSPKEWLNVARADDVNIHIAVKNYDVSGTSISQINRSMSSRGPRFIDHKRAIGSHGGGFGMSYTMFVTPGSCSMYSHTTTYRGETVLPHWQSERGASANTKLWWQTTLLDIQEHEQEHAFLAVIQALALERIIDNLPDQSSCDELSSDVKRAVNERSHAAKATNKAYDDWTENGTTGPYWVG